MEFLKPKIKIIPLLNTSAAHTPTFPCPVNRLRSCRPWERDATCRCPDLLQRPTAAIYTEIPALISPSSSPLLLEESYYSYPYSRSTYGTQIAWRGSKFLHNFSRSPRGEVEPQCVAKPPVTATRHCRAPPARQGFQGVALIYRASARRAHSTPMAPCSPCSPRLSGHPPSPLTHSGSCLGFP